MRTQRGASDLAHPNLHPEQLTLVHFYSFQNVGGTFSKPGIHHTLGIGTAMHRTEESSYSLGYPTRR